MVLLDFSLILRPTIANSQQTCYNCHNTAVMKIVENFLGWAIEGQGPYKSL